MTIEGNGEQMKYFLQISYLVEQDQCVENRTLILLRLYLSALTKPIQQISQKNEI